MIKKHIAILRQGAILMLLLHSTLFFMGCEEQISPIEKGNISLNFTYKAGEEPLQANRSYSLPNSDVEYRMEKLVFYLSNFTLTTQSGEQVAVDDIFLIDFVNSTAYWNRNPNIGLSISELNLSDIPVDRYTSLSFTVGLTEGTNQEGGLPNTLEHINMLWPEALGGGYHFMKFEGKFRENGGEEQSFAVHTGRLSNDVKTASYNIPISLSLGEQPITLDSSSPVGSLNLQYDASKWFDQVAALKEYPSMIMNNHNAQEAYRNNAQQGLITLRGE